MTYHAIECHTLYGARTWYGYHDTGDIFSSDSLEDLIEGRVVRSAGPSADETLVCPVTPSKIVCIGLNYRSHAEEMEKELPEEPLMFLKPPSAMIAHGDEIVLPPQSSLVHYEAELALVIGQRGKGIRRENAMSHVLGYTLLNDVTARDLQRRDIQYTRAKGFDTFAPCGPRIVCGLNPQRLELKLTVNGEVRQQGRCDDLIFSIEDLVAYVSSVMTLEVGDVISTGTPSGVGALQAGDEVRVYNEEIGELCNPVTLP